MFENSYLFLKLIFNSLTVGFICKKNSKKNFPVSFCDLELYQHGENLIPPKDYAFQFHAGEDKKIY